MGNWINDLIGNTIEANGVALPARKVLNFLGGFQAADNTVNQSTDITFIGAGQETIVASVVIDCSLTTKQTLYTVPAGRRFVVTRVVTRDASAAVTTASFGIGFDAAANDVDTGVVIVTSTGAAFSYTPTGASNNPLIGTSAQVLGAKTTVTQTMTVTIDVFGYVL